MLNRWTRVLLDLLFPPRCMGCGRRGGWLCAPCRGLIAEVPATVCRRCGRVLRRPGLCILCQGTSSPIEGVRAAFFFEGSIREAIHRLKYEGRRALVGPLVDLVEPRLGELVGHADVLVPVPLHFSRLRQRGYNQSALLATEMGRRVGLPVAEGALGRLRDTPAQMGLPARERKANVQGAFGCPSRELAGRSVLLVDDVCTTGSTLEACADALKAAGAPSVWGLVLARTR